MVSAMAYDWNSKLLYVTSMTESQLIVIRMNHRDFPQRTLVNNTIGIHGIALDPSQGYVTGSQTFILRVLPLDYTAH